MIERPSPYEEVARRRKAAALAAVCHARNIDSETFKVMADTPSHLETLAAVARVSLPSPATIAMVVEHLAKAEALADVPPADPFKGLL